MAANYAAQWDALNELSLAYQSGRDFTLPVLRTAFGDPPPPPSKCLWPPPGVSERRVQTKLHCVRNFLNDAKGVIKKVIREIRAAQVCVGASGLNMRDSWIVVKPLESFRGYMIPACSVTEVVKSAPAEDAALEKAVEKIEVALVKLRGKVAGQIAKTDEGKGKGGADLPPKKTKPADTLPPKKTEPADNRPKRGRPVGKDTVRRADFAKPLREKGEKWPSIFAAYEKKYPRDTEATEGAVRLAFERQYPELAAKLRKGKATE